MIGKNSWKPQKLPLKWFVVYSMYIIIHNTRFSITQQCVCKYHNFYWYIMLLLASTVLIHITCERNLFLILCAPLVMIFYKIRNIFIQYSFSKSLTHIICTHTHARAGAHTHTHTHKQTCIYISYKYSYIHAHMNANA